MSSRSWHCVVICGLSAGCFCTGAFLVQSDFTLSVMVMSALLGKGCIKCLTCKSNAQDTWNNAEIAEKVVFGLLWALDNESISIITALSSYQLSFLLGALEALHIAATLLDRISIISSSFLLVARCQHVKIVWA